MRMWVDGEPLEIGSELIIKYHDDENKRYFPSSLLVFGSTTRKESLESGGWSLACFWSISFLLQFHPLSYFFISLLPKI